MKEAKFLDGSTMRHVVNMSLSNSVGLIAIFLVDLVDIYFLSLLGEIELASAVGYAGTVLFFTTSICIGLSIAVGALVARAIGSYDFIKAKRYLVNGYGVIIVLTSVLALIIWLTIPFWLELIGARGRAAQLSNEYLRIMIPSMPILGLAMASGATLRSVGDARRSMLSTLSGGAINAVLDPIFIFGLGMGVEGAATASVCARATILFVAFYPVWKKHNLLIQFEIKRFYGDLKAIFEIALPAIMTNIATPFGMAYVTASMAHYGDSAVAGLSITGRITPVAFGVVFAVSGAIGPIIGQNFGSKCYDRVQSTIKDALTFVTVYVIGISVVLWFLPEAIGKIFDVDEKGQEIITVFCYYISISYVFIGATFVSNASFNNLGKPNYSTIVNLLKASIGTVPFVYFGSQWLGATGVLIGQAIGASLFGLISIVLVFRTVKKIELSCLN